MRDSRTESAHNLSGTMKDQAVRNALNSDTTSQTATEIAIGVEWLAYRHLRAKLERNDWALGAAKWRMQFLGGALSDPLKYFPQKPESGYLATPRRVLHAKSEGNLFVIPDRIHYSGAGEDVVISCSQPRSVTGGKTLQVHYVDADGMGNGKGRRKNLVLQRPDHSHGDSSYLLGDVYLAFLEWSPKMRQPVKAQISLNGEESHESVSKKIHQRV